MLEHLSGDLRLPTCTVSPPPPTCWPGRQIQQVAGLPYLQFSQIREPSFPIRKYEPRAVGKDGLWGEERPFTSGPWHEPWIIREICPVTEHLGAGGHAPVA